jgi:hypothetical protein
MFLLRRDYKYLSQFDILYVQTLVFNNIVKNYANISKFIVFSSLKSKLINRSTIF